MKGKVQRQRFLRRNAATALRGVGRELHVTVLEDAHSTFPQGGGVFGLHRIHNNSERIAPHSEILEHENEVIEKD